MGSGLGLAFPRKASGAVASRVSSISLRVRVRVGRADGAAGGACGLFT